MEPKQSFISPGQNVILSLFHGMWQSRCLSLLVELKIPELLCNTEEPSINIEDIATRTGCSTSKQLYPILRVLAQWGIGEEVESKHFTKNQAMELLRCDKGPSLGHIVAFFCSDENFTAMRSLTKCVREGQPAFVLEHGMNHNGYMNDIESQPYEKGKMFEGSSAHPIGSNKRRQEFADNYNMAMEYYTDLILLPSVPGVNNVYKAYPWSTCNKLVDMGGCTGYFLGSIMKQPGCEHIQGYVIDLPDVIDDAKEKVQLRGIPEHRIQFIKHDFNKPFPSDLQLQVDTVMFKNVIGMYLDDAETILRNCHRLFSKDEGRLLIIDSVSPNPGDMEHNIGINGLQIGFLNAHRMNITCNPVLAKDEWLETLRKIGLKSGYQIKEIYDTFVGGSTIFELSVVRQ